MTQWQLLANTPTVKAIPRSVTSPLERYLRATRGVCLSRWKRSPLARHGAAGSVSTSQSSRNSAPRTSQVPTCLLPSMTATYPSEESHEMRKYQKGEAEIFGLAIVAWIFASWITHIVVCLKAGSWGFLIAGAIMFP